MKSYTEIKAEIAQLEAQAEKALRAERAGVVERIKEAIAIYGLTARDLGIESGRAAKHSAGATSRASGKTTTTVGVPKYRDPATGKTWTGRGKPPNWIVGVKDRSAFLIGAPAAADGGRAAKGRKGRPPKAGSKRAGRKTMANTKAPATTKVPAVQIETAAAQ